ncbi:MAG: heme exporter protein CcmB [Planktomarina sp.]|jgi:heme exporter protein B|nr:heme exporter protein CcmB [Planktomarina sp.]MDT2072291.1 heme exporter protein CcmB [Planktomarina sp.]MDT2078521.1 heme exporter protein CcmB [Planktomarina sp.]HAJ83798.1 heme exporter protein CcmB [Paracoccaceae bacterium]|tara:strand:- start:1189 stop:1845 length:657 start_codon:yes stop_codon:yes gene_type:complete
MIQLFARDIRLAVRSGGGFGLALIFFLIVVVLIPLGLSSDQSALALVAPGVLWLGALLACLLSLDRIFGLDYEDGSLDLLATSPLPLEAVYIAKAAAHWLTTGLPLALAAPVLGVLLNLSFDAGKVMCFSLLLGTPALSLIGAFGATLTLGVKRGGLLLSLLVLPLYVPTLIFGARAVHSASLGQPFDVPLIMVLAISLGAVAILPFASGAALRINLR